MEEQAAGESGTQRHPEQVDQRAATTGSLEVPAALEVPEPETESAPEPETSSSPDSTPATPPGRHRRHLSPGRPHRALVRLSTEEQDLLTAAAARSGMSLASWVGRVAVEAARGPGAQGPGAQGPGAWGAGVAEPEDLGPHTWGLRASTEGLPLPGPAAEAGPLAPPPAWVGSEAHAELIAARRAAERIGVNLNQAVARFHALGEPPAWLETAAGAARAAVARLDEAATAARVSRLPASPRRTRKGVSP